MGRKNGAVAAVEPIHLHFKGKRRQSLVLRALCASLHVLVYLAGIF